MKKQLLLIPLLSCMIPLVSVAGLDHENLRSEIVETHLKTTLDIVPTSLHYAGEKEDILRGLAKLGIACNAGTVLAEVVIKDNKDNNLAIHGHRVLGQQKLPRCLPLEVLENAQRTLTVDLGNGQVTLHLKPAEGFIDRLELAKKRFAKRPDFGLNEDERKLLEEQDILTVEKASMIETPKPNGGYRYSLEKVYAHGPKGFQGYQAQSSGWRKWFSGF